MPAIDRPASCALPRPVAFVAPSLRTMLSPIDLAIPRAAAGSPTQARQPAQLARDRERSRPRAARARTPTPHRPLATTPAAHLPTAAAARHFDAQPVPVELTPLPFAAPRSARRPPCRPRSPVVPNPRRGARTTRTRRRAHRSPATNTAAPAMLPPTANAAPARGSTLPARRTPAIACAAAKRIVRARDHAIFGVGGRRLECNARHERAPLGRNDRQLQSAKS